MKRIVRVFLASIGLATAGAAIAGNTTSTALTVEGSAVPGAQLQLHATVSGGPFVLLQPNYQEGGTVYFYDGPTTIGQVRLSPSTGQNGYFYNEQSYICYTDGSCSVVTFRWVLSQLSTVSVPYQLTNERSTHTFHASFVVGKEDPFADGSSSPPVTVKAAYPDMSPIIDMLLLD